MDLYCYIKGMKSASLRYDTIAWTTAIHQLNNNVCSLLFLTEAVIDATQVQVWEMESPTITMTLGDFNF